MSEPHICRACKRGKHEDCETFCAGGCWCDCQDDPDYPAPTEIANAKAHAALPLHQHGKENG
jgi:hypothetical protein